MTQDTNGITRRQILGGLGAVGISSTGAALGTSAYFSDEETFGNNTLAAGELDLKVDWEEHYAHPQLYGFPDPTGNLDHDLAYSDPGDEAYVGFPDPENPHVWVHGDDLETYMAATAIEAFPDPDNDGSQEMSWEDWAYDPCEHGADLPDHLDPTGDALASRTHNDGTWDDEEETYVPLINLEDVKPGDFGEFTLSFHLCDNPGYVWLRAANVDESENGHTEPEAEVDDSEGAELAENVQTAWWYDTNGNNVIDSEVGQVDVMLAVDTSGSLDQDDVEQLESFANDLAADLYAAGDARVGGLSFGDGAVDDFGGLAGGPVQFSGLDAGGNTPMPAALEVAAEELDENGRPDAETVIVMFSDGGPNYPNDGYDEFPIDGGFTPGPYQHGDPSNSVVEDAELCETAEIADAIRDDHRILAVGIDDAGGITGNPDAEDCDGNAIATLRQYLRDHVAGAAADYYSAGDIGDVGPVLDDILANVAAEEEVFRRGTLADDLELLADGDGIPLDGGLSTPFDEIVDGEPAGGDDESRECFDPGVNYYVGFAWWLPTDVGNEVQTDSIAFDLGFFTEQCRHNDGAGPSAAD